MHIWSNAKRPVLIRKQISIHIKERRQIGILVVVVVVVYAASDSFGVIIGLESVGGPVKNAMS